MQFSYSAKSTAGDMLSGIMNADSIEQVRRRLREEDLFPMSVTKRTFAQDFFAFHVRKPRVRIKKRELLSLTTQLAIMTQSGIDLAGALNTLRNQSKSKAIQQTLREIHNDVTGGKSVSEALRKHIHVFGEAYVASVAAGEASGQLAVVLNRLAQLLRSDIRNRATLRTLLAYPILLSSISLLVIVGLVCFVLPQFAEIFSQFDVQLPKLTQILLAIANEFRARMWLWGPLLACLAILPFLSRRTNAGKRFWDNLVLNMAVVRDVTRSILIGRTFRLLGLMIQSGVPLLEGLRLTRASIQNSLYRGLFSNLEEDILNGRGLATSMIQAGFVPPAAAEMILTAEKTGTLGMVTELMGEYYEEEGETKLRELATILEPLIIIMMGIVVAMVVMSVMLPMFEIATIAK